MNPTEVTRVEGPTGCVHSVHYASGTKDRIKLGKSALEAKNIESCDGALTHAQ
jgi:hypothetical protein